MAHNSWVTTNYERAFDERPEVYAAWAELLGEDGAHCVVKVRAVGFLCECLGEFRPGGLRVSGGVEDAGVSGEIAG